MAGYVDGFLLPISKKNVAAYKKMAAKAGKIWMEHGALGFFECVGDDLKPPFGTPFPKVIKLKPTETLLYSFIIYKNRAHRDRVNKKVMGDQRMADMGNITQVFDANRMCYGGFKSLVQFEA